MTRALEILKNEPKLDLLITDHAMPGMTGADLIDMVRTERPTFQFLPWVMPNFRLAHRQVRPARPSPFLMKTWKRQWTSPFGDDVALSSLSDGWDMQPESH